MISASASPHTPSCPSAYPEASRWQRIVLWEQRYGRPFVALPILNALAALACPLGRLARWHWAWAVLPRGLALVVFAGFGAVTTSDAHRAGLRCAGLAWPANEGSGQLLGLASAAGEP